MSYIIFLLGSDNFLPRKIFDTAEYGMDGFFNFCQKIAKKFRPYDKNNPHIPQYTALENFLIENDAYIREMYAKGDF